MRRNDFFKYLLLGGGGSESCSELESEALPYAFTSNSYKLRNYRIYGNTVNGESVGDLVTEGEHAGEYLVPVTVEGKNLFDFSKIENGSFDLNDGTDTTGTKTFRSEYIAVFANENYTVTAGDIYGIRYIGFYSENNFTYISGYINNWVDPNNKYVKSLSFIVPNNVSSIRIVFCKTDDTAVGDVSAILANGFMLNSGTTALPYEPYQPPVTTNLYLPEQIKMVGDEAEYVDYKEQKQYFADGTSTNVTLPALPTLSGTNTLSVGTTVQPSKIYLQGKISKAEIVSAEPVQANVQSLQPFSLDFMPIDRSEFQINDSLTEWNVATASAESEAET